MNQVLSLCTVYCIKNVEGIRVKLYKTAILYLSNESQVQDARDETVYKALCSHHKLRCPECFETWITRILLNECHNLLRHQKRETPVDTLPQTESEAFDTLPLKEAIRHLPPELKFEIPAGTYHDTQSGIASLIGVLYSVRNTAKRLPLDYRRC